MNKKVIIIFVNLILVVVLVFILAQPLWNSVRSLKIEVVKQKQEVGRLENLLVKVQKLEQEYQEIGLDVEKISLALPQERDIPYLIAQFETLASSNGLLLESIKLSDPSRNQGRKGRSEEKKEGLTAIFPYLSFDLKLNGSYDGIKGYLESLENNVRLMDVKVIDFNQEQSKEETGLASLSIFKFNLKLIVYYES